MSMTVGVPLVTGVLLVYYAVYVLWAGTRLLPLMAVAVPASAGNRSGGGVGWGQRAELALACRLSMGLAMLAMLLTL